MKSSLFMAVVASMLIAATSCKSKSQREAEKYMNQVEKTMNENSPPESDEQSGKTKSPEIPQGMENIVGDWELVKIAPDDNDNHILDPQEAEKGTLNYQDLLILNADGSCEYTIAKMKGSYKIETTSDGRKKLVMYDMTGAETSSGRYIVSVTENELVINRIYAGSSFEVFKRL